MKQKFFKRNYSVQRVGSLKFLVAIFLCLAVLPLILANIRALKAFFMSSKEYGYIEANLGSLQGRKENLDFESYSFESGFGVEKEIREKFPVAKDGEEVIIFTESGDLDKEADFFDGESGIWSKIVNFLGI